MDIKIDETMSLALLVEAHIPDNVWQHIGTVAMVMSFSNADALREKTKQHPSLVLQGDFGVGKSSSQYVNMWHLCWAKEVFKIDCDTKNITVKRIAAKQTLPICMEDNNSKEKKLTLKLLSLWQLIWNIDQSALRIDRSLSSTMQPCKTLISTCGWN